MLESHHGFETRDGDAVRAILFAELGATHFDLQAGTDKFALKLHWYKNNDLTLVSSSSNSETDVKYSPASFVRQYFELSPTGRYRFSFPDRTAELSCSSSFIIVRNDTPFRVEAKPGNDLLVLRIGQNVLNRKIQHLLGTHINGDLRLDDPAGPSAPRQLLLKNAVVQLASDLDVWGPNMPSLARADLEQALIAKFLLCNDHNFTARLLAPQSSPSLAQLRQIEEYIEANWEKPLDLISLASTSSLSARSIFRYFKTIRGTSPGDFIRAVRLRNCRRLLQEAQPNASVIAIALKCGFQSPGHFSRQYREAFGELPSETLRRTRNSGRY